MSTKNSILIVEDDPEIGELLTQYLTENDFDPSWAKTGKEALQLMAKKEFNLLLLDLNLPDEEGLSICRDVRQIRSLPIIILTARSDDIDKIIGLEMGADDYVTKPFNPRELLARIKANLRRVSLLAKAIDNGGSIYTFDGWRLSLLSRQLQSPLGVDVPITGAEFDLLQVFCESPGRLLSRDQLIAMTHGQSAGPYDRSIDVLISRLRQKLGDDTKSVKYIKTVRSEGYIFVAEISRN